jgi:acylphosphatase
MTAMTPPPDDRRVHVVVSGHVQGVGFRQWSARRARSLALTGWIRNRADGTVEAVAEGSPAALDDWLRHLRNGPPSARVTTVAPRFEAPTGEFSVFEIR